MAVLTQIVFKCDKCPHWFRFPVLDVASLRAVPAPKIAGTGIRERAAEIVVSVPEEAVLDAVALHALECLGVDLVSP